MEALLGAMPDARLVELSGQGHTGAAGPAVEVIAECIGRPSKAASPG
ncbi:MAG TPA: hypothetical protein VGQ64_12100 [Candidatus Limnocylindrales bacterium]|jgi:hypothetical protein|nr:hypothetical protein [Candidatus Limnocylindrales bacterium]